MKIKLLAIMAKLLGIQFHVNGLPYGASYQFRAGLLSQSPHGMSQAAQSCDSRATKVVAKFIAENVNGHSFPLFS